MKSRYFYGYNIVGASFLIQGLCIGAMFTYGVFFKNFQEDFGWSRAMISGASSLAFLMMGGVGMLSGVLNDRIGPRIILTVSGICVGLGYLLLSQLTAPWQLYLFYGVLVGIGFSTHDVITLSTIARWTTSISFTGYHRYQHGWMAQCISSHRQHVFGNPNVVGTTDETGSPENGSVP